ncbi:MAG: hypothetical protein IIA90_07615 [Chloroflexi bacterium]|nr:hypothetical protein [Chloroflexota bacterium]
MAWLTSLFKKPETIDDERTSSAQDLPGAGENGAHPPSAKSNPQLAILAPDIAGISAFRLRFFPDAATAAADIEQLPPEMRRGTHAFWALHDEPVLPEDGHREALVLIRANHTSDVVYAVSFVDMKSAWSFARFEAKRGLDISHLIILWAAFATIREELDGVSVLPAAPPPTKAQHASTSAIRSTVELEATETVREYERREEPTISDVAAAPEAPEEARLAEAETERRQETARRAEAEEATRIAEQAQEELRTARAAAADARAQTEAETARRQEAERLMEEQRQADAEAKAKAEAEAERRAEAARRAEAEEASRIAEQAQEELRAARAAADAARAQAEAETARRQEAERRLEEQRQAAEAAARSRALADMASGIESALTLPEAEAQEPVVLDATSVALEGLAEAPAQPLAEPPTDYALDDEAEPAARGTVFAHTQAAETEEDTETVEIPEHPRPADDSGDPADDLPKIPKLDEFDIAYEVARLLENRRFDKREEPFHGFESPPGKF